MKLFKKNKNGTEVTTEKDQTPWWIPALAELFAIFLFAYTRAKKKQEERMGNREQE